MVCPEVGWSALRWLLSGMMTTFFSGAGFVFITFLLEYAKTCLRDKIARERHLQKCLNARQEWSPGNEMVYTQHCRRRPRLSRGGKLFEVYRRSPAFLGNVCQEHEEHRLPHGFASPFDIRHLTSTALNSGIDDDAHFGVKCHHSLDQDICIDLNEAEYPPCKATSQCQPGNENIKIGRDAFDRHIRNSKNHQSPEPCPNCALRSQGITLWSQVYSKFSTSTSRVVNGKGEPITFCALCHRNLTQCTFAGAFVKGTPDKRRPSFVSHASKRHGDVQGRPPSSIHREEAKTRGASLKSAKGAKFASSASPTKTIPSYSLLSKQKLDEPLSDREELRQSFVFDNNVADLTSIPDPEKKLAEFSGVMKVKNSPKRGITKSVKHIEHKIESKNPIFVTPHERNPSNGGEIEKKSRTTLTRRESIDEKSKNATNKIGRIEERSKSIATSADKNEDRVKKYSNESVLVNNEKSKLLTASRRLMRQGSSESAHFPRSQLKTASLVKQFKGVQKVSSFHSEKAVKHIVHRTPTPTAKAFFPQKHTSENVKSSLTGDQTKYSNVSDFMKNKMKESLNLSNSVDDLVLNKQIICNSPKKEQSSSSFSDKGEKLQCDPRVMQFEHLKKKSQRKEMKSYHEDSNIPSVQETSIKQSVIDYSGHISKSNGKQRNRQISTSQLDGLSVKQSLSNDKKRSPKVRAKSSNVTQLSPVKEQTYLDVEKKASCTDQHEPSKGGDVQKSVSLGHMPFDEKIKALEVEYSSTMLVQKIRKLEFKLTNKKQLLPAAEQLFLRMEEASKQIQQTSSDSSIVEIGSYVEQGPRDCTQVKDPDDILLSGESRTSSKYSITSGRQDTQNDMYSNIMGLKSKSGNKSMTTHGIENLFTLYGLETELEGNRENANAKSGFFTNVKKIEGLPSLQAKSFGKNEKKNDACVSENFEQIQASPQEYEGCLGVGATNDNTTIRERNNAIETVQKSIGDIGEKGIPIPRVNDTKEKEVSNLFNSHTSERKKTIQKSRRSAEEKKGTFSTGRKFKRKSRVIHIQSDLERDDTDEKKGTILMKINPRKPVISNDPFQKGAAGKTKVDDKIAGANNGMTKKRIKTAADTFGDFQTRGAVIAMNDRDIDEGILKNSIETTKESNTVILTELSNAEERQGTTIPWNKEGMKEKFESNNKHTEDDNRNIVALHMGNSGKKTRSIVTNGRYTEQKHGTILTSEIDTEQKKMKVARDIKNSSEKRRALVTNMRNTGEKKTSVDARTKNTEGKKGKVVKNVRDNKDMKRLTSSELVRRKTGICHMNVNDTRENPDEIERRFGSIPENKVIAVTCTEHFGQKEKPTMLWNDRSIRGELKTASETVKNTTDKKKTTVTNFENIEVETKRRVRRKGTNIRKSLKGPNIMSVGNSREKHRTALPGVKHTGRKLGIASLSDGNTLRKKGAVSSGEKDATVTNAIEEASKLVAPQDKYMKVEKGDSVMSPRNYDEEGLQVLNISSPRVSETVGMSVRDCAKKIETHLIDVRDIRDREKSMLNIGDSEKTNIVITSPVQGYEEEKGKHIANIGDRPEIEKVITTNVDEQGIESEKMNNSDRNTAALARKEGKCMESVGNDEKSMSDFKDNGNEKEIIVTNIINNEEKNGNISIDALRVENNNNARDYKDKEVLISMNIIKDKCVEKGAVVTMAKDFEEDKRTKDNENEEHIETKFSLRQSSLNAVVETMKTASLFPETSKDCIAQSHHLNMAMPITLKTPLFGGSGRESLGTMTDANSIQSTKGVVVASSTDDDGPIFGSRFESSFSLKGFEQKNDGQWQNNQNLLMLASQAKSFGTYRDQGDNNRNE